LAIPYAAGVFGQPSSPSPSSPAPPPLPPREGLAVAGNWPGRQREGARSLSTRLSNRRFPRVT
jgi:hypothetical protein